MCKRNHWMSKGRVVQADGRQDKGKLSELLQKVTFPQYHSCIYYAIISQITAEEAGVGTTDLRTASNLISTVSCLMTSLRLGRPIQLEQRATEQAKDRYGATILGILFLPSPKVPPIVPEPNLFSGS